MQFDLINIKKAINRFVSQHPDMKAMVVSLLIAVLIAVLVIIFF